VSDIDIAVADSLKVLDLKWPIREADICYRSGSDTDAASSATRFFFGQTDLILIKANFSGGARNCIEIVRKLLARSAWLKQPNSLLRRR
jgi:hypothetical protein